MTSVAVTEAQRCLSNVFRPRDSWRKHQCSRKPYDICGEASALSCHVDTTCRSKFSLPRVGVRSSSFIPKLAVF